MNEHQGEIPGQISLEEAIADVERSVRTLADTARQSAAVEPVPAEQLTEQQLANRAALAAQLRDARDHAKTVHEGQYGRSLGFVLGFLSHIVGDPKQPLGLMPRHAQHVVDYLTEQARHATHNDRLACEGATTERNGQ